MAPSLQQSLERLQMDYVDLYLVHSPFGYKVFEDLFLNFHPVLTRTDGSAFTSGTVDPVSVLGQVTPKIVKEEIVTSWLSVHN